MEANLASPSELYWFNQCRIYLKVFTIADIATANGRYIRKDIYKGQPIQRTHQSYLWPKWGRPKAAAWTIWRRILKLVFTNGLTMDLNAALGPWINFNHNR